jgi:4-hydroxy-tetrahydrodipicolinate synthase
MSTSPAAGVSTEAESESRRIVGLLPPLVTPFQDGSIDHASLERALDYLTGNVAGVLLGGSVGEVPSLTVDERSELLRAVARRREAGVFDLVVAIGDNSIENTRRLLDVAGEVGVDLVVVSLPNYFANSVAMLEQYLGAIAEMSPVELCLYDNPLANHTPLTVAQIATLAASVPRLTHVKVTDTALEKVAGLRAATDLVIHAGDDAVLWHQLARGVDGAMVALPMLYPERAAEIWRLVQEGEVEQAYAEYRHVTDFIHVALGAVDYVAVIKTVLHERGVIASPEVRLPLLPLPPQRRDEVLRSLGPAQAR